MRSSLPTARADVREEYRDASRLLQRLGIYAYRRPQFDLPLEVAAHLRDVSELVLDVGCGHGRYVEVLKKDNPGRPVAALDLSPGMLSLVRAPKAVADVCCLPIADRSCGAVLAMHVLYYVTNPGLGVREVARVVRRDGVVVFGTNSEGDKRELIELMERHAGGKRFGTNGFALEDAEELARQSFGHVARHDYIGRIEVDHSAPILEWVASTALGEAEQVRAGVRLAVERQIQATGSYSLATHGGLLVCRDPR